MFRKVLAVALGIITGGLVVAAGETVIHSIYPMGELPTDREALAELVAGMPLMAEIMMVLNWALAGFLAASITNLFQGRTNYRPMLVTVGVLQLLTYMNMIMVPGHPGWMWLAATFLYIIMGFTSYGLLKKRKNEETQ